MSEKAFSKIMQGLKEAKAYMEGEREGYKVTVPPSVDVKSIRKGLHMTQAAFSDSFGFSLDTVKQWEGGPLYACGRAWRISRRAPEFQRRGRVFAVCHALLGEDDNGSSNAILLTLREGFGVAIKLVAHTTLALYRSGHALRLPVWRWLRLSDLAPLFSPNIAQQFASK